MDDIAPATLAILSVFTLAGIVKGVVGLGLPTVAMGLLTLVVSPAQAAALLLAPSLSTNVWQAVVGPGLLPLVLRLWPVLALAFFGTLAGIGFLNDGDTRTASALLGLALVTYAAATLWAPRLQVTPRVEQWLGPLVGLTTGLVTGATGVFVVPAVPYLQALGLDRDHLVQALGLSFTVSTVALGAALALQSALPPSLAVASLLAVLPAVAGMAIGQWLRFRIAPSAFRLWFLLSLLGLGGWLALRGLHGD